jgi:transcription antitermination factor NusG
MPANSRPYNGLAWFAVAARPRWEKFVSQALAGKGFEAFFPLNKSRRRWSDRIKELDLPLFSGCLFCRMSLEQNRLPILTTPGVRQIRGIGKVPIAVSDDEMEAVRAIVASGLAAQPWPFVRVGDCIRIKGGSLNGVEGLHTATKKHHRLVVSVELLRRLGAVDIDQAWVEPLALFPGWPLFHRPQVEKKPGRRKWGC